jgi:hypothetical protein
MEDNNKLLNAFDVTAPVLSANAPEYGHPLESAMITECTRLLNGIPEGKRLVEYAKTHKIPVKAVKGRIPNYYIPDEKTIILVCPANPKTVDRYEMACNLGLGIREIELYHQGLEMPPTSAPEHIRYQAALDKSLDMVIFMIRLSTEIEDVYKTKTLVDLIGKMGHDELYKGYRLGKSESELREILKKSLMS